MGKVYVVTGATSGIGRALVERISSDSTIYAGYRNELLKSDLESISDNIYPFYVDYSKPETIKTACEYILSKSNKIDRLINIAGCVTAGPIENIEISEIKQQFDINVFGHLEFTQYLINAMKNGRIINISSMASFGIFPFISPYCASKKCMDMFFNALLVENKKNIQVVSIKPGVISTPLWGKSIEKNSKYFHKFEEYSQEMNYVINNAKKNETSGLNVQKVVDVILKVDSIKDPKLSYTVGKDAFAASLISKLPQKMINKTVKFGIRLKTRKLPS